MVSVRLRILKNIEQFHILSKQGEHVGFHKCCYPGFFSSVQYIQAAIYYKIQITILHLLNGGTRKEIVRNH